MLPDIYEVADILGIKKVKRKGIGSRYYICPFCNDKTGHLNIVGGDERVWRCAKCGKSGGVIGLVEAFLDVERAEAKRFLFKNFDFDRKPTTHKPAKEEKPDIADADTLDKTYSALLSLLTLSDAHCKALQARGLSEKAIEAREYRSVPSKEQGQKLCEQLIKWGYSLNGVPGFYTDAEDIWQLNVYADGVFIPFRDVNGKITMIQTRVDHPSSSHTKYITLSASKLKDGTRAVPTAHYVGSVPPDAPLKKIILTEGALKADVAIYLRRAFHAEIIPFLAIPGVNNTKALRAALTVLKSRGLTDVYDGFDMDKSDKGSVALNDNVQTAVKKVYDICQEMGFTVHTLEWNQEKGIDDYYFYLLQQKRRP